MSCGVRCELHAPHTWKYQVIFFISGDNNRASVGGREGKYKLLVVLQLRLTFFSTTKRSFYWKKMVLWPIGDKIRHANSLSKYVLQDYARIVYTFPRSFSAKSMIEKLTWDSRQLLYCFLQATSLLCWPVEGWPLVHSVGMLLPNLNLHTWWSTECIHTSSRPWPTDKVSISLFLVRLWSKHPVLTPNGNSDCLRWEELKSFKLCPWGKSQKSVKWLGLDPIHTLLDFLQILVFRLTKTT